MRGSLHALCFLALLVSGGRAARLAAGPLQALGSTVLASHGQAGGELRRPGDVEGPKVVVEKLGVTMVGTTMQSLYNRTINSFLGIRYAGASRRFKYSALVEKLGTNNVEYPADHMGPKCWQNSMVGDFAEGDEDCLYLNVYVPADKATGNDTLPVMVFIHGGSFTSGDASLYLPTRLLDEDVILVVIQYRLGALGWLSLLNNDLPGNAGLSDQINALKWVQAYIEPFNGDPEKVTVFGQSAGSASVSTLVAIPAAKGLFARAIAESGSSLEYWAIDEHPVQSATAFAELCGCDTTDESTILHCLQIEKTPAELTMCTSKSVKEQQKAGNIGFDGVSPVVQPADIVQNALITMLPADYMAQGLSNNVPFMSGCVRDEGSYVYALMLDSYLKPNNLTEDGDYLANQVITDILKAAGIDDSTRVLSQAIADTFFPGVDMTDIDAITPGMIDLMGMLFLKSGTYNFAKMHSRFYNTSTYFYSFDFVSENSLFDLMFPDPPFDSELAGVTHADELMYLFSFPTELTEAQRLTSKRLVKLWTNFAKTGKPSAEKDDSLGLPVWKEFTEKESNFLLIQDELEMKMNYPERYTIEMQLENPTTPAPPTDPPAETVPKAEYDDLQKQSDAFMACMIVFIVLFVASTGGAIFFYLKTR